MILAVSSAAHAVVIDIDTVGNPGNAADDTTRGAVDYTYNIGKYEVTAAQYCDFLNHVAATDTYGLYSTDMWSSAYGCKIQRSGSSGNYSYSVASDWANRPVNFVSYWDSARFANWLHNGQSTGLQNASTTEDGAYFINGYNDRDLDGRTIQRKPGAKWFLPSEDEWYKAAYYKAGGQNAGYWDYPTASNTTPSNVLGSPTDPGNNATYYDNGHTIGSPYCRTLVGAHENSDSPYGTFDQGGNVWEWNEALNCQDGTYARRGVRGGSYGSNDICLHASFRDGGRTPTVEGIWFGFRVSEAVPEPSGLLVLGSGILALAGMIRRRR